MALKAVERKHIELAKVFFGEAVIAKAKRKAAAAGVAFLVGQPRRRISLGYYRQGEMRTNNPQRGRCPNCLNLSVRLLEAPLVRFDIEPETYHCVGGTYWFNSGSSPDPYEIAEVHDDHIVCLVPEAERGESYCYRCWNGYLWPSIRPLVINMPDELQYNPQFPWAEPKWVSKGRELKTKTIAATLSGLFNCHVCGDEKCRYPDSICVDCSTPPF